MPIAQPEASRILEEIAERAWQMCGVDNKKKISTHGHAGQRIEVLQRHETKSFFQSTWMDEDNFPVVCSVCSCEAEDFLQQL